MRITSLAHVALYTKDIERSLAFYELLGGRCYTRASIEKPTGTNQLAMVRLAGFDLELIQPGDGTPVQPVEGTWPHIALETERIEEAVEELKAAGIDTFCTDQPNDLPHLFGGLKNIFFYGPDGEKIELIEHL
jgi:catechol 2,3-dioxygenase-like lactoylglutathione lyase family enzyme